MNQETIEGVEAVCRSTSLTPSLAASVSHNRAPCLFFISMYFS